MEVTELLRQKCPEIVTDAFEAMERAHVKRYENDGPEAVGLRLHALFEVIFQSLVTRNAAPVIRYAEKVAKSRFQAAFGLHEVQTAFNVLEEAIWKRVMDGMDLSELGRALGLVGTVVGMGKDALARTYVSLASETKVPTLDLRALFRGTDVASSGEAA